MTFRDFTRFDETNAPAATREALAQNKRLFGAIPAPLAAYAGSPLLLQAALSALSAFEQSSLLPLEREVLAMTMGRVNGCNFCVSLHRRLLAAQHAPAELVSALEAGQPLQEPRSRRCARSCSRSSKRKATCHARFGATSRGRLHARASSGARHRRLGYR